MVCKEASGGRPHILCLGCVAASTLLISAINCIALADTDVRFHEVWAGETLAVIANSHGVSYRYLACLNGIVNPDRIRVGQRIELPRSRHNELSTKLNWPINLGRMTSPFGPRRDDCHDGIDIAAPLWTPVRAAGSGKVVFSGVQNGYGKVVIIQHAEAYQTLYAHLQKIYVNVDQEVQSRQRIARVGTTGRSSGPHLHFEIREGHKAVDPMFFLPQETQVVLAPKASFWAGVGGN